MNTRFSIYYGYFVQSEELMWEDYVERAHRAGADGIELSALALQEVVPERRKKIACMARERELAITFATALKADGDISSPNPIARRNGVEELKRQILLAEEMGGSHICGIIYGLSKNMPQGIAFNRGTHLQNALEPLYEAGTFAYDHGIQLCVEIVNRFETPLLNTVEEGVAFVTQIGNKGVRLHLDTFHMNIEEDDICKAIRRAKGWVSHLHFSENNRKLPGGGHLPWRQILLALQEIDYNGGIAIESLARPFGNFSDRLNIWRDYVHTGIDEDLKESLRFLRGLSSLL